MIPYYFNVSFQYFRFGKSRQRFPILSYIFEHSFQYFAGKQMVIYFVQSDFILSVLVIQQAMDVIKLGLFYLSFAILTYI